MTLDRRIHAYRDDLADLDLRGKVKSSRFVSPILKQVCVPVASVMKSPAENSSLDTQALMGEFVHVFDEADGWAWVKLAEDHYVGYVRSEFLTSTTQDLTHRVGVASTLIFPKPDLKSQPVRPLSFAARFSSVGKVGDYLELATGGFVYERHTLALPSRDDDFVALAEQFVGVPYLWGGKSASGFDCSGLVQIALQSCGRDCPRDADMQEADLGLSVDIGEARRGDLVFWKGHVGIMCDRETLLHANGYHLMTIKEPLRQAITRIAEKGFPVTSVKRLQ
jgi:cell wall-associated NlpC family hydrolase